MRSPLLLRRGRRYQAAAAGRIPHVVSLLWCCWCLSEMAGLCRQAHTSEAMLRRWKGFIFDGCDIGAYRSIDAALALHEILDEARLVAREDAQHIVHD